MSIKEVIPKKNILKKKTCSKLFFGPDFSSHCDHSTGGQGHRPSLHLSLGRLRGDRKGNSILLEFPVNSIHISYIYILNYRS